MDKKVCVHCNKVNEHDKYVTCICNTSVHYECLHPYGSTPNAWISSNPVIKHVTSILESPSFLFRCNTCIGNSIQPSCPLPLNTFKGEINNIESSTKDILIRLDKQDKILNNICKLVNNTSTIYKHIIPPTFTPTIPYNPPKQHLPPPTHPLNISYSSAVRQSPYMPINKVNTTIPVTNTTPSNSLVIEHLNEDERNINFVYKILSYLNMSTNSLTSYKFINSICVIYFNSPNSQYTFHSNVNHIKKDPRFSHLYIREQRSGNEIFRGRVIYHAIKESLTPTGTRCTYNNFNSTFELRNTKHSKIDWYSDPTLIKHTDYNKWKTSYEAYLQTKYTTNKIDLVNGQPKQ